MSEQEPVAWAVFEADGHCVGTYAKQEHAKYVIGELAYDGMVFEPLYRQPGPALTDEERFVLREVRDIYADEDDVKCNEIAAVIDGLLERMK